jgi:membrane-associated phospholipid phosphatase/MFS family permease
LEALSLPRIRRLGPAGRRRARSGVVFFAAFGVAAVGVGAGRAITTSFLPVLLERIQDAPALIGAVMLVNAAAGFVVPLMVGLWSDRRRRGRMGRRVPFIVGGTLLSSGGLVAIALGTASSYVVLALAAAAVYVGLNATTTAHRAIVVEGFEDGARPAATSAQEVAILVGGLAGVVAGGALIDSAAWLPFIAAAVALPLLAAPTVTSVLRHLADREGGDEAAVGRETSAHPRDFVTAMRRPGAREVLVAQVLWVMGYAALPAFFILYAGHVLAIGPGPASLFLAGFGLVSGAGMLVAGRTPPERVYPTLVAGAALLGGGLLAGAFFDSPALLVAPFASAALGFGLVTALGFPYFARFVPGGQSGRYSGLYFSARAIASTVALPVAGLLIAATGSYRVLLLQGAAALLALVPLARARERRERSVAEAPLGPAPAPARPLRPAPRRLGAVIPSFGLAPLERVVAETVRHTQQVVVVDDGSPPEEAERIDRLASRAGVPVVRLDANSGKGDAVAAGVEWLLGNGQGLDAVIVVDSDGQHAPERIPEFVDAARSADIVIGNRRGDTRGMPRVRRVTNFVSSGLLSLVTRRRLPDTQCGMRLYRAEALERVPLPGGRYESESRHLKAAVRAGLSVGWVPIPAIYDGAPSSFRPLADSARVLGAILGPTARRSRSEQAPERARGTMRRPSPAFLNAWGVRLGALVAGTLALGGVLPLFGPLDRELFLAVNSLGDGPEWVYSALDPHSRNYILLGLLTVLAASLVRPRRMLGAAFAVVVAAVFSDLLLQSVYLLFDRPRPEEAIGSQVLLTHGRTWAHIASFPSGHLAVTTAMAVAAMVAVPALRAPLWVYVGAVALTRITFGAHFPLDVAAGAFFGYEIGLFSAALAQAVGLLPASSATAPAFSQGWIGALGGGLRRALPAGYKARSGG